MTKECKIEDLESGWSKFYISNDQTFCEFEFSYLDDAIEQMIFVLNDLNQGNSNSDYKVVFPEEPGQNTLYITCISDTEITLKITSSPEWEMIAKVYNRNIEENLIYTDVSDSKKNFIYLIIKAINDYLKSSNTLNNKIHYEKMLRRFGSLLP